MPHVIDAPASRVDARLETAFKALGSAQRLEILRMLAQADRRCEAKERCAPEEVCACKIMERLGLAASTISHHMSILREAGLVDARRDGSWVYYRLRRDVLTGLADTLSVL